MDSYIVRIYRRSDEPAEFAGQVEKAGTDMKMNFHSSSERVQALMSGCSIHECTPLHDEIRTY